MNLVADEGFTVAYEKLDDDIVIVTTGPAASGTLWGTATSSIRQRRPVEPPTRSISATGRAASHTSTSTDSSRSSTASRAPRLCRRTATSSRTLDSVVLEGARDGDDELDPHAGASRRND